MFERNIDTVQGHGRRGRRRRHPFGKGHGGNCPDSAAKRACSRIFRIQLKRHWHAGLDGARATAPGPDERLHQPAAFGQGFSLFDEHAVERNVAGYVAKQKPRGERQQENNNCGDKQAFTRRGNCQQPVELFAFFLGFGNHIME